MTCDRCAFLLHLDDDELLYPEVRRGNSWRSRDTDGSPCQVLTPTQRWSEPSTFASSCSLPFEFWTKEFPHVVFVWIYRVVKVPCLSWLFLSNRVHEQCVTQFFVASLNLTGGRRHPCTLREALEEFQKAHVLFSTLWRLSLDSWIYQSWIFWRRTVFFSLVPNNLTMCCFRCVHFNNLEADVVLCMIVAFQGRPQPTLTINDGSLTGCDSKTEAQSFESTVQISIPTLSLSNLCRSSLLEHFKPSQNRQRDKMGQAMVNPCQSNHLMRIEQTYRFDPYTASSLHRRSTASRSSMIGLFRGLPHASGRESTQSTVNSCAIWIDLAVPVAFALLLGEMETWYLRLFEQDLNKGP